MSEMDPKDRVLTASGDPQAGDVDVPEGEFETDSPGGESDEGEAADGGEGGDARPAAEPPCGVHACPTASGGAAGPVAASRLPAPARGVSPTTNSWKNVPASPPG